MSYKGTISQKEVNVALSIKNIHLILGKIYSGIKNIHDTNTNTERNTDIFMFISDLNYL